MSKEVRSLGISRRHMGPAGTPNFKIVNTVDGVPMDDQDGRCKNCRLCPANGFLPVRPRFHSEASFGFYVVPVLKMVTAQAKNERMPQHHLVPVPFCAEIVQFTHTKKFPLAPCGPMPEMVTPLGRSDGLLMGQLEQAMRLVPSFTPGDPFNLIQSYGYDAGARPQGWEENTDAGNWLRHGSATVVYGRDLLAELGAARPTAFGIITDDLDVASIIHASRVAAGSLPNDDQLLWNIWEEVAGDLDNLERYHDKILARTWHK